MKSHKPVGLDMLIALGGGKKSAPDSEPDPSDAQDPAEGESDLPPDFEAAWRDYHDHPSAQSFWDAVEACTAPGKSDKGSSKGY